MSVSLREPQEAGAEVIRVEGIGKSFGPLRVLENISFQVRPGEIIALLGASGCGKSTLLNILSGLLPPDEGQLLIQDRPAAQFNRWQTVGYLFQEDRLLPWRTVGKNIHFGLENGNYDRSERQKRVEEVLRLVNLQDFEHSWPHQLSGGMRSRVALARSLVAEPEILLMDEPFSKLDPQTRSVMHNELLRIQRLTGMTVVMVTHDVEEAVVLADRVVILRPNPGHIHHIHRIALPHPRVPTSPEVAEQARLLRLEV
ncbi:ABC transporter ATP-binding protein [Sodalis ligni]|uniref:ABC transporter ATP-binding protein n=1 Tax=Sodalis ligni TaxID=2697027 RepID=UPI001BDE8708|nr:ABC transporter ATP-binding protein [Sodalis ligni]QWA13294.1 ABC transporter ATP-binding protein [Sodalis ligni]